LPFRKILVERTTCLVYEVTPHSKRKRSQTMVEKKPEETAKEVADAVRETAQIMTKSIIAAQERNMKFVQTTFTNATEVMKSHAEATRALMQELEQQQEALQNLVPGMETVMGMLRAPLSTYQKALEAVEKSTQQGLETVEKAAKDFEQATPQHHRSEHTRRESQ
jgi:acetoin utilization deacetylase AcuC-like enzyme